MQLNRLAPVAFALTLCGCGSIGSIGAPPAGTTTAVVAPVAGGLPPAGTYPPPGGAVIAEPLPPADGKPVVAVAPAAPVAAGPIGRTDLLGGWTIASSGDSCQLFMTLTSWTGGYRASTRGCASEQLKSISAWNLERQAGRPRRQGGRRWRTLSSSGGNRFDGQIAGGGPVTFYR